MKKDERYIVNKIVPYLERDDYYVFVDRDLGQTRIKSGWDFLIAKNNQVIFIEAKIDNKKLTAYQDLTKSLITITSNTFLQINFLLDDNQDICGLRLQSKSREGIKKVISIPSFKHSSDQEQVYCEIAFIISNFFKEIVNK